MAAIATDSEHNQFDHPHAAENEDDDHFFIVNATSDLVPTLLAIFGQITDVISPPYDLDVTVVGNGTVTKAPTGIDCGLDCSEVYDYGTDVQLTATAATGSTFTGWSVDHSGTTNPDTVTMDGDKNVTATFIDATPPVITLVGSDPVTLELLDIYVEAGATATDNYDGDLSGSIVIGGDVVNTSAVGQYTVTYDVTDSSLNPAVQVTRTVNVEDNTAPVIALVGANPVTLELLDIYVEAGATATDNYDGDLSASIVIGGDVVNTSVVGQYTVTYDMTDS